MTPERREQAVRALSRLLLSHLERRAGREAVSWSRGKVLPDATGEDDEG